MARQNITKPAKGDAANNGSPGPTPAPVRPYQNPNLAQTRAFSPNYGTNNDPNPSSIEPGTKQTSPLADELRRVAAKSDGGDLLGDIAAHGTSRNVSVGDMQAPQTRDVAPEPYRASFGMRNRNANPVTIPAKLGSSK